MKEEIIGFLNNPIKDYQIGIRLLSSVLKNKVLLTNLSKANTAYTRGKIISELQKAVSLFPIPKEKTIVLAKNEMPSVIEVDDVPAEILDAQKELKLLYKEIANLRANLFSSNKVIKRLEIIKILVKKYERTFSIKNAISLYKDTKQIALSIQENVTSSDYGSVFKREFTLRTYLTKYRKLVKDNPDNEKYKKKLEAFEKEMQEIILKKC